jgi:hypothetical protein
MNEQSFFKKYRKIFKCENIKSEICFCKICTFIEEIAIFRKEELINDLKNLTIERKNNARVRKFK